MPILESAFRCMGRCARALLITVLACGGPGRSMAQPRSAPGLYLAFDVTFGDVAVCGTEVTLALAPTRNSGPMAPGFIRCPRDGGTEYFSRDDWLEDQQADLPLHLGRIGLHTPRQLRAALRRCLKSQWLVRPFRVVGTDGVDRALLSFDAHFHLVRASADTCAVLQRWRIPEDRSNYLDAKLVKTGAYVLLSRDDMGHDDAASLYLRGEDGVRHVLDGAVTMDIEPNTTDSRALVVVTKSPRFHARTASGLDAFFAPPWLGLELVDGPRSAFSLGAFRQLAVEGVMVRSNPDLSLIAVARLGGLLPSVVLMGEKACQAMIRVLNSSGRVPSASETTPSAVLRECSTEALTMPHR